MRVADLLGPRWAGGARPDAVALEGPLGDRRTELSQAQMAAAVVALVAALPKEPQRIGVLSNHRLEAYLTVLASVVGGHTFVPLNPKFPLPRLRTIVDLADLHLVVHDAETSELADQLGRPLLDATQQTVGRGRLGETPARLAALGERKLDPSAVAYTMFTSGSTGTPKGVPVTFASLTAYVHNLCQLVPLAVDARHTQFFDLSFDLSMHDIFVSQHSDGVLVGPSKIDHLMPGGYVRRERIDVWFSVPLLGAQLARAGRPEGVDGVATMLFCGEALPMETVAGCRAWLRDGGTVWNLYGPTEATIAFTGHCVGEDEPIVGSASIGRPFGSNRVAILQEDGGTTAADTVGEEGELLLGGEQVFTGYSTPAPSPFVDHLGEPFYRSGDLVRVDHAGLYYRGRVDSQVKYRGYRVELGEIEAAMRRTFGLHAVAVVLRGEGSDAELKAYYLAVEADAPPDLAALGETLPPYMIPGTATALESMPTNANGKIDRKVLP